MEVDTRLNDIDDCLYRIAARALIIKDDAVLLVREVAEGEHWSIPGGGVDHGETIESSLTREVEEELGVPAKDVASDFEIIHYNIGNVVNGVPRMNLFFKVQVPEALLKEKDHISEWRWFTRNEFMEADLHPSYDKTTFAAIIFAANE